MILSSRSFKIVIVFCLAFLTGINFVVYPALGTAFTDVHVFGLSQSQFGNLFLPQTFCIVVSAVSAPFLVNKWGPKKVMLMGLCLMSLSTIVLWSLRFFLSPNFPVFQVLLVLVACVGLGFGSTITTLNPLAASLFPEGKGSAILILQFLVGVGTSTAPLMMMAVGKTENWMYVPLLIFILMVVTTFFFLFLKFEKNALFQMPKKIRIPIKLWMFFFAILLYGLIEGTFGGFGAVLLKDQGFTNRQASLGMALFWGGIAINRLFVGWTGRWFNLWRFFLITPLLVGLFLQVLLGTSSIFFIMMIMFSIGFFMGSIFPGAIGWGTIEFPSYAVVVSGFLMAADQIGTGVITQILGRFKGDLMGVIPMLGLSTAILFLIFLLLSRHSKIKDAF